MLERSEIIFQRAIQWIKKTKEIIDFAHQIEASIIYGLIKPQNIIKEVYVGPENDDYMVRRDWANDKSSLKADFSNTLKINIVSYQIIVLKESYATLFSSGLLKWAEESIEPDLWAAQKILQHVRNALGHCKAEGGFFEARATWDFTKDKKQPLGKLKVIAINVVLDITKLQGKVFSWSQIGGIKNFIKVLDYLISDLELKLYSKQNEITGKPEKAVSGDGRK